MRIMPSEEMGGGPYLFSPLRISGAYRDAVFYCMRFILNGESIEITDGTTIAGLLCDLGIEPGRVAVEVNLSIIKRAEYAAFHLKDGDTVEIVNFVEGG
jgi:sulfur carrier protein